MGGLGFAPSAPGGGGATLAEQRAPYKAEVAANPAMRETMAAIMISESSTPAGQQGTAEAMMNRVTARGQPFSAAMDPAYHADYMVQNKHKYQAALDRVRSDPQLKAQLYDLQDKAFNGSNVSNLATDYSSGATAAKGRANSTHTFTSPDGQSFFRKDINPTAHGPTNVANTQAWHQKTTAAMAAKPTAAPQASAQASAQPARPAPVVAPPTAAAPASPAAAPAAAKPAPQVNPAHALLDTKIIDLVKSRGTPAQVAAVPGFIANKTLREAINTPVIGGQVLEGVKPYLGKAGVTLQQFDQAVKEGPPKPPASVRATGRRSEAPLPGAEGALCRGRYRHHDRRRTGAAGDSPPSAQPDGPGSTVETTGTAGPTPEVNAPAAPAGGAGREAGPPGTSATVEQPAPSQGAMTPEMAQALTNVFENESRIASEPLAPEAALPVLPAQPAVPAPGAGGGGLSLAPAGLSSIPTGALSGAPGSQGGSIAMAGMLPPIQNATFSTPLLDQTAASGSTIGQGNLTPIPWETLGSWGWGGGSSIGSGFDWGGGGGYSMPMFGGYSGD